jgi:hypothetical protein
VAPGRRRAYQLIDGYQVAENVQNFTQIKESHTAELAKLPPDQQREVYQKAVDTAPEGKYD